MQRTFTTDTGKVIAPDYFAVFHRKDGSYFTKIQDEISLYEFDAPGRENVRRIELYKNGTDNLSPELVDRLDKE